MRALIVVTLVTATLLYALSYVLLSLPSIQHSIKGRVEQEVGNLLETKVNIDYLDIEPFTRIALSGATIYDLQGRELLRADRLGVGIDVWKLITERRVVLTYAELLGVDIALVKENDSVPVNAQFIIDKFKPKPNQPPRPFDVSANNVIIRRGHISYDRLDLPLKSAGIFDPNHVEIYNLRADLLLEHIKNDDFAVAVNRIALIERSGLTVDRMSAAVVVDSTHLAVDNLDIALPESRIAVDRFELHYDSLKQLGSQLSSIPVAVKTAPETVITPSDFKAFLPQLANLDSRLNVALDAVYHNGNLAVNNFSVNGNGSPLTIELTGNATDVTNIDNAGIDLSRVHLSADTRKLMPLVKALQPLQSSVENMLTRCSHITLNGEIHGTLKSMDLDVDLQTAVGTLQANGNISRQGATKFAGHVMSPQLKSGELLGRSDVPGELAADLDLNVGTHIAAGSPLAVAGHIDYIYWQGVRYDNIDLDIAYDGTNIEGNISADDEDAVFAVNGTVQRSGTAMTASFAGDIEHLNLPRFVTGNNSAGASVSGHLNSDLTGSDIDDLCGETNLDDFTYTTPGGKVFHLQHVGITANGDREHRTLALQSDFINASLKGKYTFKDIAATAMSIASDAVPQLVQTRQFDEVHADLQVTVEPREELSSLLKLPVKLLDDVTLQASIRGQAYDITLSAPYLLQGNKVIEQTRLTITGDVNVADTLCVTGIYPHKQGKIPISLMATAHNGVLDSSLQWAMERERDYSGELNLGVTVSRDENGKPVGELNIMPSHLTFNDTVWTLDPATVRIGGGAVEINNLRGSNRDQFVHIDGRISHNPLDVLSLDLNDMSLDYVFDTLNINNVDFGGSATGRFYAADLLSGAPQIYTPRLHVDNITYNNALMGDADISSRWLVDEKAVALHADINQANGLTSVIDGAIYVAGDSLSLNFDARRANIAFMKPFMAAFAADVQGQVSGNATLFGTFKDINLKGEILADTLNFLLDFTNVRYSCRNESIHIKPGLIELADITMMDRAGNTARLNGWLRHDNFHQPVFEFGITDANGLLCYDTNERINPVWYGEVYGNGSAFVTGRPGLVDIKVNMESSPGSKFTFVMSNAVEATEYKFITFRSKRYPDGVPVAVLPVDTLPEAVKQHYSSVTSKSEDVPTAFNIDLQGDITPDVSLVIVMDPIGGDQIKATGSGNMRLTYNNHDEMEIYGKYTLERGHYNFTLQDIIIKDFIIRDGSSITFHGDPYAATLDLKAVYPTNANLRDLDESFANDTEIQRTNVPVYAVLLAKGLMSQPEIDFDLEFPTLNSDAVRKVHSIVSTEEMMNQQIIYLLAINKFYTPEYTDATRNGNELTSVASSTISSQLSSMLGKMSDNWTISPNFRSDKGDFSDVEVELALSSQLLNNRLLFNGNFGYRDNTYNTRSSNFIGDFDIEYLLNSRGTLRLRAYNRFNDQNYYLRNAMTTQGVGIVWKHDFDNLWQMLHFKRRRADAAVSNDTIVTPTPDTVP